MFEVDELAGELKYTGFVFIQMGWKVVGEYCACIG